MPLQRKRPLSSVAADRDRGARKRNIGSFCAVPGCSNYSGKTIGMGVSYFKFPKAPNLLESWVKSIRRGGRWNPEKSHVCSTHFKETDFERDFKAELLGSKKRNMLKPGVVPSQNLPVRLEEDGCHSPFYEDRRSIVSSLPNDQIIEFEFGSSDESMDGSAVCDETTNAQSDYEEMQEDPEEDGLEHPISHTRNTEEAIKTCDGDRRRVVAESENKETIITFFAGCEQSEHLKTEISKLRIELKAKEDSLFILEQSSALKAKQQMRIIKELTAENGQLKSELKEKNDKISTLEEALATDTKLRSIFSPEELQRFLKRAKKWAEM